MNLIGNRTKYFLSFAGVAGFEPTPGNFGGCYAKNHYTIPPLLKRVERLYFHLKAVTKYAY